MLLFHVEKSCSILSFCHSPPRESIPQFFWVCERNVIQGRRFFECEESSWCTAFFLWRKIELFLKLINKKGISVVARQTDGSFWGTNFVKTNTNSEVFLFLLREEPGFCFRKKIFICRNEKRIVKFWVKEDRLFLFKTSDGVDPLTYGISHSGGILLTFWKFLQDHHHR